MSTIEPETWPKPLAAAAPFVATSRRKQALWAADLGRTQDVFDRDDEVEKCSIHRDRSLFLFGGLPHVKYHSNTSHVSHYSGMED